MKEFPDEWLEAGGWEFLNNEIDDEGEGDGEDEEDESEFEPEAGAYTRPLLSST
jgi:hypothetical protein